MLAKLIPKLMPFENMLLLLAKIKKILFLANRIDIMGVYYRGRNDIDETDRT